MIRLALATLLCLGGPAAAGEAVESFRLGPDAFFSGGSLTIASDGIDDLFAAGERIELAAPVGGSAHFAGRRIAVNGGIAGDVYAAGADVTLDAPVAGDATLAGYDVAIQATIGGDVRAAARHLRVAGPVAGSAFLSGGTVTLDGTIEGDAALDARELTFGPRARVTGRLMLYGENAATQAVPATVADPARIDRHQAERGSAGPLPDAAPGWFTATVAFVVGALITALLAALVAVIVPRSAERLWESASARPFHSFWIGFLTLSTLLGATLLAVLSILGIVVAPAILVATVVLAGLGYLVGVWIVGRAVWGRATHLPPDTLAERALAALAGAVIVALLALVPFVGWLVAPVLTLIGLGAMSVAALRPSFRR